MLLPDWYRPTPEDFARRTGMRVIAKHPHAKRSLAMLIHSIPYFHVSMKHSVYEIVVDSNATPQPIATAAGQLQPSTSSVS